MATETQTPPRNTAGDATTADLRGWLTFAGVMFLVGAASNAAYGIVALADDGRFQDEQLARTMGMTTFAIANPVFSFTARDELRSVFSLETVRDRTFLMTSLMSVAAIIFATELRFFQRILDTVALTGNQWLICIGAGLLIVVASEIRKLLLRRQAQQDTGTRREVA